MRPMLGILGGLTLLILWWGPLAELARQAFFAHMVVHMAVVAIAAPLFALSLAGGAWDPVRRWPTVFAPIPASMIEFVFVWAWHAPQLHYAARHSSAGLAAEQGTFLFSGLLLWLSAFGGDRAVRGGRAAAGVIAMLLTAMHMALLGVLIGVAPRTLYGHSSGYGDLTPLQDQQLGGAIMVLMGGVTYLAGGLWLVAGLLKERLVERQGHT